MKRHHSEDRQKGTSKRHARGESSKRNASVPTTGRQSLMDFNTDFLCDQTVIFEGNNSLVNIIGMELAEKSPFFERLLRYHLQQAPILLPGTFKQGFVEVIKYIRHNTFEFSKQNVLQIFMVADYLLLLDLRTMCIQAICSYMKDAEFAYEVWKNTRHFYLPDVGIVAFNKLIENFIDFRKSRVFATLQADELKEILMNDCLNVRSERFVFDTILSWLELSGGCGETDVDRLFTECRLGLLTQGDLAEVQSKLPESMSKEMHELMQKWPDSANIPITLAEIQNWASKQVLPRMPYEAIFVFGGWCESFGPKSAVQVYDPRARAWTLWPDDSDSEPNPIGEIPRRVYTGCICVDDKVYLVGGFDGTDALKSTLCYDFQTNTGWYEASCMYEKRYYVSVAFADGQIYALGGHNGENRGRMNSCERYCIQDNTWRLIQSMNSVRSDASAAAVKNKVYICGGFDGRIYHASSECYDPITNAWTVLPNMSSPRGGVAIISYKNFLYAVGGNSGSNRLNTLERYNVVTGKWEQCGEMLHRKSNLSLAVMENLMYIIGGWSDEPATGIMQSVEAFDLLTGICIASEPMCFPASATCACTIRIGCQGLKPHIHRRALETVQ